MMVLASERVCRPYGAGSCHCQYSPPARTAKAGEVHGGKRERERVEMDEPTAGGLAIRFKRIEAGAHQSSRAIIAA